MKHFIENCKICTIQDCSPNKNILFIIETNSHFVFSSIETHAEDLHDTYPLLVLNDVTDDVIYCVC